MENIFPWVVGIIIAALFGWILWGLGSEAYYSMTHHCVKSHEETQYEAPPSVVVGGGKYGGGVAVPVGNLKPVQVSVCDEYAPN